MKITQSDEEIEGRPLYDLVLSREDIDLVCSGFGEEGVDCLYGRLGGLEFYVYEGIKISDAWRIRPGEGFF